MNAPPHRRNYHVEWRQLLKVSEGAVVLLQRRQAVRGSRAAKEFALSLAGEAWAGEFRISGGGGPPCHTDLGRLRAWREGEAMPEPGVDSAWSRELDRMAGISSLSTRLEAAMDHAERLGILSRDDVRSVVALAASLTSRS